jgi:adenine-specific DNA-methyltransferase
MPIDALADNGWTLSDATTQQLLVKLRAAGKPLREYVQDKIFYGIKTGLNEAFVIDEPTRARLVAADPRSAEVIKPFLAGRDIKRYQTPVADKFLILFERGITTQRRGDAEPETWLAQAYPAIYAHLKRHEAKAKSRSDKGLYWWELRACEYYAEFEKPHITIPAIIKEPSAAWDEFGGYSNDKTTIIGVADKYVLAVLNSSPVDFFMRQIAATKQGGYFEYKPVYLAQIPIPEASLAVQSDISVRVDVILALKREDLNADTSVQEAELDVIVCGLYGVDVVPAILHITPQTGTLPPTP